MHLKKRMRSGFKLFIIIKIIIFFLPYNHCYAQQLEESDEDRIDRLTDDEGFLQHAGLPAAASKIYFTDAKFAVSGFGEAVYNQYFGPRNKASGDLELYNTNLYRFITYLAYKPWPWLVMYAEVFGEFMHDGTREADWEIFTETFLDFLISEYFNLRVGTSQLQIGFINNNDEPVLFYSVNRPEVERVIIPSQWMDLGIMAYGKFFDNLNYSLSVYEGLDAMSLNESTWLRGGREHQFRGRWRNPVLNTQVEFHGLPNSILSLSGIYTNLAGDQVIRMGFNAVEVNSHTFLLSSFIRNEWDRFTLLTLASYGYMKNTDRLFQLNQELLGRRSYGFYIEAGYDILPLLIKQNKQREPETTFFYHPGQLKLPVFIRYERLNTHAAIHTLLQDQSFNGNNLHALVIGANFNSRHNIVLKTNYQFRWNKQLLPGGEAEGNRLEFGLGFIF
jgi:hypothetical protein